MAEVSFTTVPDPQKKEPSKRDLLELKRRVYYSRANALKRHGVSGEVVDGWREAAEEILCLENDIPRFRLLVKEQEIKVEAATLEGKPEEMKRWGENLEYTKAKLDELEARLKGIKASGVVERCEKAISEIMKKKEEKE